MRTFRPAKVAVLIGCLFAVAFLSNPTTTEAAAGDCTTAFVHEAFVLPDGSEHDPGSLTVCVDRRHSPVAYMHRTYVDGMGVGLHFGRHWLSEGPATDQPYMLFVREANGLLSLAGYAVPGRQHMEIYTLDHAVSGRVDASRTARRKTAVSFTGS